MRGKFISLEGGEGSGKSTIIGYIQDWLESENIRHVMTREPGGTDLSEEIRSIILKQRDEKVDNMTELLLVFAARAQHLSQKIRPALDEGIWVISDRFTDSSFVYQGTVRSCDSKIISYLTEWVVGKYTTDITFLLDVPIEIGLKRVTMRKDADRLDKETREFYKKIREGFLYQAKLNPDRIKIIDASQPIELVKNQIHKQLNIMKVSWSKG